MNQSNANPRLAPELKALLGPPLLYPGESVEDYDRFYEAVRASVRPKDMVEELYLHDAVDYAWEARRCRRLKRDLVESGQYNGLYRLLSNLVPDLRQRDALLARWARGDLAAKEEVSKLLAGAGFEARHVEAQTVVAMIEHLEVFERQILKASQRMEVLLREIERARESLARRIREGLVAAGDEKEDGLHI